MGLPAKKNTRRYFRARSEAGRPIRIDINGINFLDIIFGNNISEGGMNFEVPHEFKGSQIDGPVSLIISLPRPVRQTFTVNSRIRHLSGKVYGVAFSDLDSANRLKIRKYISHRIKEEPWITRLKYRLSQLAGWLGGD